MRSEINKVEIFKNLILNDGNCIDCVCVTFNSYQITVTRVKKHLLKFRNKTAVIIHTCGTGQNNASEIQ